MLIYRGYKTELQPTNKQRTLLLKAAGIARFVYNWGLTQKKNALDAKTRVPTLLELSREMTKLKASEYPWMREVSRCASQYAFENLEMAFKRFFRKKSKFPQFKNKKDGIGSFCLKGESIRVVGKRIQLPKLGKLKLKECDYIPTTGKILSATVSEKAGRWFVSVLMEKEFTYNGTKEAHDIVGVDLGIKSLAVVSDGRIYKNIKPLKSKLRKLKRLQKLYSKKQPGSRNGKRAAYRVAHLHYRIGNLRKDILNKITTELAKTKRAVGIEDLDVLGMLKNEKLALSISDVGFSEWRKQLEYKGLWYNCQIVLANRFFPSTKTCSSCGYINPNLTLADRSWVCPNCDVRHDRDFNASLNLEKVAIRSMETQNACGGDGTSGSSDLETPSLKKQERSREFGRQALLGLRDRSKGKTTPAAFKK